MGVQGLTRLLREEGWLPSQTSCTQTLWRDSSISTTSTSNSFSSDRIVPLPAHSTLALDGNGLAYYLHRVAYGRHFAQVTRGGAAAEAEEVPSSSSSTQFCSCPSIKKLQLLSEESASQVVVQQLLPQFMPLSFLEDVTKEFVLSLQRHHMVLHVYWDGEARRCKQQTASARKEGRDDEWGHLQQYCLYGIVDSSNHNSKNKKNNTSSSSLCQQDWLSNFPMTRLFVAQVQSTLAKMKGVSMIQCDEEADVEVARASHQNPHCYSVGLDSDYCLFPNIQYVPLNTLHAAATNSSSGVSGCVLTRADLARHLDLPTEEAIVEMAILMGNDYIVDPSEAQLDFKGSNKNNKNNVESIMDHLRDQGPEYRVVSKSPQVQLAIDFTRTLHSFGDVSHFPLDQEHESDNEKDINDDESKDDELNRPELPEELDLTLATLEPLDFSLADVVLRPLQAYVDLFQQGQENRRAAVILQEHLDAFQNMVQILASSSATTPCDESLLPARPEWRDVLASYVIERSLAHVMRTNPTAPAVRLASPSKLFDHQLFHMLLQRERQAKALDDQQTAKEKDACEPISVERTILPIDEHEDAILDAVESQRVTIIHGETGCGKSSRVPVMLLRAPPPDPSLNQVKMFISQPRRIAAKSLVERVRSCEPDLKLSIALRMGHGVREYENSQTRAWFVTTGYLVRLLANHPERFKDCSHLIIDEVHERSVDTDILCLLCRRLLDSNRTIRLILMSATMAATLYQQYFGVPEPPIHVGARRFSIKEFFVEDLIKQFRLPPADLKAAHAVSTDCENLKCAGPPSNNYMENLFRLAARVTLAVGRPGSSVLIFVPGMNEIISIIDLIEKVYVPGIQYTCFPIHSDVPFDEQMAAFDSPAADEVKVVIATNAAESSVTLPDVDHVICLGLCKQIVYNPSSHRQMLMPAWISRASATQRAGRTGRVREGNVYRLYTRNVYSEYMDMFERGEMLRIPLDSVILTLKEMLKEQATPVLLQCIEPPDMSTIERSYESLCRSHFITKPNDNGDITTLGAFVSSLGIDLALGSLIGLGIQFGVGAESVEMAAVLSFPQSPWHMTNPLYHEASAYNDITARTYMSRCHFDANLYSDPMAVMNLMWDYERAQNKNGWTWHYSVSAPRLRRLLTTRNSLRNRVADFVGIDSDRLCIEKPPVKMSHAKVTILRCVKSWVFSDTMIESIQAATTLDGSVTLALTGDSIDRLHLEQVLNTERHAFRLTSNREIDQNGSFTPVSEDEFDMEGFTPDFESRFVSFSLENNYDLVWYMTDEAFHLFAREDIVQWKAFAKFRDSRLKKFDETCIVALKHGESNRRGRDARACGLWSLVSGATETSPDAVRIRKWSTRDKSKSSNITRFLKRQAMDMDEVTRCLACVLSEPKRRKGNTAPKFSLVSRGQCTALTKGDLHDLFATPNVAVKTYEKAQSTQTITFPPTSNSPLVGFGQTKDNSVNTDIELDSSWHRPLLNNIPEGARLLSVLASGRRKDHAIQFSSPESDDSTNDEKKGDRPTFTVSLNRDQTKISQRWRQFATDRTVYVGENSIPASALSMTGPTEVFACCVNTLEVRGGGLRVEGITLMPPGRLFLLLSFLSFGLRPFPFDDFDSDEKGTSLITKSLKWLSAWDDMVAALGMEPNTMAKETNKADRIRKAVAFHKSCAQLGETLVCHPDKVEALCSIFDMIDGYDVNAWETLQDDPFTTENLREGKSGKHYNKNVGTHGDKTKPLGRPPIALEKTYAVETERAGAEKGKKIPPRKQEKLCEITSFPIASALGSYPDEVVKRAVRLFATKLDPGERIGELDLPSTNILSTLLEHYRDVKLRDKDMPKRDRRRIQVDGKMSLTSRHWIVYSVTKEDGKEWFTARFVSRLIPLLPLKNRGSAGLPGWVAGNQLRPASPKHAFLCVPPQFSNVPYLSGKFSLGGKKAQKMLFYESIETAIRMEAAFWLERQFGGKSVHWFMHPLEHLVAKATESLEHT